MAFDVRAMENIATAPASVTERVASRWISALAVLAFALALPIGATRLPGVAAFVPAVAGVALLAQSLTAFLFWVQYRIARGTQLAILAAAYASSALLTLFYILAFPGVFSPTGLFGATLQTSAYINEFEHILFAGYVIAFALGDVWNARLPRRLVPWFAVSAALVVATVVVASLRLPLPAILDARLHSTVFSTRAFVPFILSTEAFAIACLIATRVRTVTQVWLLAVLSIRFLGTVSVSALSGGRYTVLWYEGRTLAVLGSTIFLAVFLTKLNDLLLRLARRNLALTQRTEIAEIEIAQSETRYRTLANVVPNLIWSATSDGTVDYVNDRWIDYTGLDLDETCTVGWRAALDDALPRTMHDGWHESLRTGRPFSGEFRFREAASGRARWFLVNVIPMRDADDAIARWIGSCTDIDRQKRIEEREAFLAGAGDRLSASLDTQATLRTIAALVLGRMAAWARVDFIGDDGHFTTAIVASSSAPEETALRVLLQRRVPIDLEQRLTRALDGREPLVDHDRAAFHGDLPGVRTGTSILVPLTSGETVIGMLTLVRVDREEPDGDELAIARDFGRRAAQALEHARLYEGERSTADTLQRAMLPASLPLLPNVAFSASYSAASETQRVGGDFYDAFVLPDGRVALTIGDVTGHGLEAAVIMGEIRQALRAASFERAQPSLILDRASALLVASGRNVFVTAVFGILDTQTGRFEYATAGHPAPLVFDGQKVKRLATSGLPIGLRDDEGVDFAVTLGPQHTLVLYTDGLLEFTHDLDEGERRIEAAIRELDRRDGDHLANVVMRRVLRDDEPDDDIAILTATVLALPRAQGDDVREWRFRSSDARTATAVRHDVGALVAQWTRRPEEIFEAELVFGELFSNVVRHAPGTVSVGLAATPAGARLSVTDTGDAFAPADGTIDTLAEHGRGLHLIRALSDDVRIEPSPNGTRVVVDFHRAAAINSGSSAARSNA